MEHTSFTAGEDGYSKISRQDIRDWKDLYGWK